MAHVGQQIQKAREERGLSMRDLSKIAKVSVGTIWNIENQATKRPHGSTVRKLLQTLQGIPKLPTF